MTPDAIDRLLADFHAWLLEHAGQTAQPGVAAGPAEAPSVLAMTPVASPPEAPPVDLHTLVAQFTALRHEVNLQTRAARTQMEANAAALDKLGAAVDALDAAGERTAEDEAVARAQELRPLLGSLVEVHDALTVAQREGRRVDESLRPLLEGLADFESDAPEPSPAPGLDDLPPPVRPGLLARLVGAAPVIHRQQQTIDRLARQLADRGTQPGLNGDAPDAPDAARKARQVLDSLLAGYAMSLQRVERALYRHGLQPIPAEGEPYDPECMEVLEAVADSGLPPGYVVTEVRRGYLWNDRLFRPALVRVARPEDRRTPVTETLTGPEPYAPISE